MKNIKEINKFTNKKKYLIHIFWIISSLFLVYGDKFENFNVALIGVIIAFIINCLYSIKNLNKSYFFFMLNLSIFLFVLSRPFISMLRGDEWWYFSKNTVANSLNILYFSFLSLFIGSILYSKIRKNKLTINEKEKIYNTGNLNIVTKKITFLICIICIACDIFVEIEKIIVLGGHDYASMYLGYQSQLPYFIIFLSQCLTYSICLFLATLPNKRMSIIILLIYVCLSIPVFIIGSRNSLIIRGVFIITYFVIRQFLSKNEQLWITRKTRITVIILIPIIIVTMGAYNYIREDSKASSSSITYLAVDFLYKQGTTYDTLCQSIEYKDKLPKHESYTFGSVIDQLKHGKLTRLFFNTKDLGTGNNILLAKEGNSLAHHISYIVLGNAYLEGHGRGSSYLAEVFLDFGYLGVIVFNFCLGALTIAILDFLKKGFLARFFCLISSTSFIALPRDTSLCFINYIFSIQFIFILAIFLVFMIFNERKKYA
ncbi:O-antigen polysaccharide polymerase Wzy family protein [[Clostridium] innocuum]|nr:O-antigen polysaccharide polymerase Wzy family protein [[Clostridium] innocuum]